MSSKAAARLAAWKAKQAAKGAGSAAAKSSAPAPAAAAPAPAPAAKRPSAALNLNLKSIKKPKKELSKPKAQTLKAPLQGGLGGDSEDDSDDDDQPKAKPLMTFDSESEDEADKMDVDDDGDDLDAYMKSHISTSSDLVKQDTSAIGGPTKPKSQAITFDEVLNDKGSVQTSNDEAKESEFLEALKKSGTVAAAPPAAAAARGKTTKSGIDVDALKAAAQKALESRNAQTSETGRLFETDDGPEESERLLEIYNLTEKDREAIAVSINKKKFIADVDHSKIDYISIQKNLYIVPPKLRQKNNKDWTKDKIQKLRYSMNVKVRGAGTIPIPVSTFEDAGVQGRVLEILKGKMGIEKPFAIQSQCLPCIMSGRDVIGIAKTGSGKTLAFVLPMLRSIMSQPGLEPNESGPIGLILAPARELALQIHSVIKQFCKHLNLRSTCVYGGGPVSEQIGELKRGSEIVVATPGRLIDILTMQAGKVLSLKRVCYVVMDEADRMFDMGFAPQIGSVLAAIRPDRQLCLFSATFPKSVEQLARESLKYPVEVMVGGRSVASDTIEQFAEVMPETKKFHRLLQLLGEWIERGKVLVFVDTQQKADEIYEQLTKNGYTALSLHGGKEQDERDETISEFRDPQSIFNVLVATSVAGRGLDVPSCRLVINYSAPNHIEDYVHRVGRTGRAGKKGTAYTLVNDVEEGAYAKLVVKALSDAGWSSNVPEALKDLAAQFDVKVEKGEAKSANRGYGGRGFTYDSSEKSQKQKLEAIEKKKALIEAGMIAEDSGDEGGFGDGDADAGDAGFGGADGGKEEGARAGALSPPPGAKGEGKTSPVPPPTAGGSTSPVPTSGPAATQSEAIRRAQAIAAKLGTSSSSIMSLPGMSNKLMGNAPTNKPSTRTTRHEVGSGMRRGQKLTFYVEELEINNFCREARWMVTKKETILRLNNEFGAAITNKGTYFPPGKKPDPAKGERGTFLSVETTDAEMLNGCLREINRLLKEETIRVGGGSEGHKYSIM
ncbi:hypothetical protein TrST_g7019 [Triparma strigata]|uniref:RNA helicase n=1 Tax=Triparma strigata TaxID=1606541 RepID=A0A9W7ASK3_9STRA|nr:hypothetical protein TrST_g7019 [Triparma strigata]